MGKRPGRNPLNSRFIEDSIDWTDSPEDELSDKAMDTVWTVLEKASINARKRKIIWPDGQKLSINLSVKRIHADHQDFPIELIETQLIAWIAQVMVSPYHSEQQLDELNRLTEKWIEAHERQAATAAEGSRTRHS
jgi:hypothetical protein